MINNFYFLIESSLGGCPRIAKLAKKLVLTEKLNFYNKISYLND